MADRRIYAMGDVHGRADLLRTMLDFISRDAAAAGAEAKVMFLGDLVDRGPDSRDALELVVETVRRWPQSRLLLGNHDRWFLEYLQGDRSITRLWLPQGGAETLRSYLEPGDLLGEADAMIRKDWPEHVGLLETASMVETDGPFAFVHAGINPARPIEAQVERDCLWIREPFLDHVGVLSHVVVHGHTPLEPPRPHVTENRISLDTGAWFSGLLTALVIDEGSGRLSFHTADAGGEVEQVEPVRLDRGFGCALDRVGRSP